MSDDLSAETTIARLCASAADTTLAKSARAQARELADRLTRVVRIVLMGPKSAGKSALCDAIFAQGATQNPATGTRIFAAEAPELEEVPLGKAQQHIKTDLSPFGPAQVIDLGVPEDFEHYENLVAEGIDFADIVLWCTQSFEPEETALWADACDALKDHSFLVLTKADILADAGVLQDRIASLQPIVSEEFHSIFPVTTSQLRHLQVEGDTATEAQIAASGLKALIDAVEGIVRSGRSADLDSALLFLERHGKGSENTTEILSRCDSKADDVCVAPRADADARFTGARDVLMQRAFDLAELGFDEAEDDMSEVLELCSDVSIDFVDKVRENTADDPDLAPWSLAFEEASDKIMLMAMENDTRSAADAVTILLQLRRDMDQLAIH